MVENETEVTVRVNDLVGARQFSLLRKVHAGFRTQPFSCPVGIGQFFVEGKKNRNVKHTTGVEVTNEWICASTEY
jgi:hypothetical protein